MTASSATVDAGWTTGYQTAIKVSHPKSIHIVKFVIITSVPDTIRGHFLYPPKKSGI